MSFPLRSSDLLALCSIAIYSCSAAGISEADKSDTTSTISLEEAFENPPPAAHPWVFWYWMNGCISAEGITADLEAMERIGIGGAYLMPIRGPSERSACIHPVAQQTPEWWRLLRHAMLEARRLNLKLAMHACDGFAVAGGPWITPELSMQKVVWSATKVSSDYEGPIILPQPETNEGYYQDIAVWAFPSLPGDIDDPPPVPESITTSLENFDASFLPSTEHGKRIRMEDRGWIEFQYAEPFTCRSITITPDGNNYQAQRLTIKVSEDSIAYREVCQLKPPRQGWQNGDGAVTFSIPSVTAKYYRFSFDREGSEPGGEDLDSAKWSPVLKVRSIELSSAPRIHQYRGKSGAVWRISMPTTKEQVPDALCIDPNSMLDLTNQTNTDGELVWQPPSGNWTILRMGHTSTSMRNETGGAAKGLECDKLNSEAVRLQFDRWFGEIHRQMGSELAGEVLKVFHVDSWECGSQNWTADFAKDFKRRRGYDPVAYLPAMAGYPIKNVDFSEDFLHDVRETIADLLNERFFHTLAELAHELGCQFSAECVAPTMLSDGMHHFAAVDIPMGEFWLNSPTHDKPNDIRDAVSAAHVYGKPIVQAEAFTEIRMNWRETPGNLKALGDLHFCLGINRLVFHVFTHNPYPDRRPGMTLDNIGLFFQRDQTWWNPARSWIDYISRCQALLQLGEPVVDIAIHTGEELPRRSLLPDKLTSIVPGLLGAGALEREQHRVLNAETPIEESSPGVRHSANLSKPQDWCDPLRGYAYDSINSDALKQVVDSPNNKITLSSGLSYSVLVDPTSTLPEHELKVESIEDQDLNRMGIAKDFELLHNNNVEIIDVAWIHRRLKETDLYFVSNQSREPRSVTASFRVQGKVPELWDPLTGDRQEASSWTVRGRHTQVDFYLPPSGSLFVIFRRKTALKKSANHHTKSEYISLKQLSGNWQVQFDPEFGGPSEIQSFAELIDWTDHPTDAIRFYSGVARYELSFSWKTLKGAHDKLWLNLGKVFDIASVTLNGNACGTVWTPLHRVRIGDMLIDGENLLEIEVINTWNNRMLGDRLRPAQKSWTWTTASPPPAESPLAPAGLLGPVSIQTKQ